MLPISPDGWSDSKDESTHQKLFIVWFDIQPSGELSKMFEFERTKREVPKLPKMFPRIAKGFSKRYSTLIL
jgi:hypothetical protein